MSTVEKSVEVEEVVEEVVEDIEDLEPIVEVKLMVKSLKHEMGSLKQDVNDIKELLNKYVNDQEELASKGWLW